MFSTAFGSDTLFVTCSFLDNFWGVTVRNIIKTITTVVGKRQNTTRSAGSVMTLHLFREQRLVVGNVM